MSVADAMTDTGFKYLLDCTNRITRCNPGQTTNLNG